jgi:hypothetical protein
MVLNLTEAQENALIHYAVKQLLEKTLEEKIDKEIAKQHTEEARIKQNSSMFHRGVR